LTCDILIEGWHAIIIRILAGSLSLETAGIATIICFACKQILPDNLKAMPAEEARKDQ
jgi:hypothetical protein